MDPQLRSPGLNCCSGRSESTLQKTNDSNANYFHRIQTARKFAYASCELHYAVAERHLIFLRICKMVLQNNT